MGPIVESIMFVAGGFLAVLIRFYGHQSKDWKTDASEKHFNFWSLAPIAFIIATATVYSKNNLHNHWLFGLESLTPILICTTNFIFGMTLGFLILLITIELKLQINAITDNLKKSFKAFQLKKFRGGNYVAPSFWDRFTPESQIKYLESFLSQLDNHSDRESLEFWKIRKNDTERGGYTFRISLGQEELGKLNFNSMTERDYLAIEFWKTPNGSFKARTTSGSNDNPKKFTETTVDQLNELKPHLQIWYRDLS